MEIEILHIDDCPNWQEAGARVRQALQELGAPEVPVTFTLLSTVEEAAARPFAGSPTVLIDGVDAFPSDGATADLACRVYRVDGRFAGAPSVAALRAVLAPALYTRG
jgi:hypothetical protein